MSQRLNRHRLLDPRPFHSLLENLLCSSTAVTLAGFPPFKKPFGWPIFLPVFAQDLQGSFAEKRVAVFVSFSIINADHHTIALNIRRSACVIASPQWLQRLH